MVVLSQFFVMRMRITVASIESRLSRKIFPSFAGYRLLILISSCVNSKHTPFHTTAITCSPSLPSNHLATYYFPIPILVIMSDASAKRCGKRNAVETPLRTRTIPFAVAHARHHLRLCNYECTRHISVGERGRRWTGSRV